MNHLKKRLYALTVLLCLNLAATAQPTWPATGPTQHPFTTLNPDLSGTPPSSFIVRHVNCDMYTDYSSGTAGDKVMAITWDYFNTATSSWYCALYVYDEASGTSDSHTWPGTMPDVAIGDYQTYPSSPGAKACFVTWIDPNGDPWVYNYSIGNAFNNGGIYLVWLVPFVNGHLDNSNTTVDPPHIDAFPDPVNSGNYFGGLNSYVGLSKFVVTWSSAPGGSYNIYSEEGPSFPNLSGTLIDAGRMPDVAGVSVDNSGVYTKKAHFIYADRTLSHIYYNNWDLLSTVGGRQVLESNVNPEWTPRIDAMNVEVVGSSACSTLWRAVAEVVPSAREIHGYDETVGTGYSVTNYSSYNPLNGTTGHIPAIAAGPGPDATGVNASAVGNTSYTAGWYIWNNEINALSLDNTSAGLGLLSGYKQVNNNTVNNVIANWPVFAVSNSSNSGDDILTAWCDGINIYAKHSTGNSFAFKLTDVMRKAIRPLTVSPNPAHDVLQVSNAKDGEYYVTDMLGRNVASGKLNNGNNTIQVSALASGSYVLNVAQGGITERVKFVKE